MEFENGTFLDDVITTLGVEAEHHGKANISQQVLMEFFSQKASNRQESLNDKPVVVNHNFNSDVVSEKKDILVCDIGKVDFSKMNLNELADFASQCDGCPLAKSRNKVVFGQGSADADLMFIGEGPGRDEDMQGIPFVGEAGQLLTKMINAMKFKRSEVYISNIVKCRPPNNRNPEDLEAKSCMHYLARQIELIQPEVIVLLGAVPLKYLLGKSGITKLRGHWDLYNGIKVMPTFHPAYLLRTPSAKREVWADLQQVMRLFGKLY